MSYLKASLQTDLLMPARDQNEPEYIWANCNMFDLAQKEGSGGVVTYPHETDKT